ncbi:MAG: biosynthetic-type acetolactate synthase large subunit [Treponema sp.]|nr:biosynthetic-type acetolactate synthase large subunit [Treponema sp.]
MRFSGARILIESLIDEGVDTVFGIPGASALNIYDELYRQRGRIRHVLVTHEQHAAHAADGYARASGRTGVCIATSGPGATNLITGIAAAYMDSSPLVAITGNVPLRLLGKDSFQEVDIAGISMPVVKHNWIVKDVTELSEVIREAFIVARIGRSGPVLIDIPQDVCAAETEWKPALQAAWEDGSVLGARARRLTDRAEAATFTPADIAAAAAFIEKAERPFIYAGGGVNLSGAGAELCALAKKCGAPVAFSLMGIGAVPADFPLATGLIGMHGTIASNRAVQKADLVIACGARFSNRVTGSSSLSNTNGINSIDQFARNAKILHIDIDPAEINKNKRADCRVVGDLKKVLAALLRKLKTPRPNRWGGEIEKLKALDRRGAGRDGEGPRLRPAFIMRETARAAGKDAMVITDVGQHQMWAARYYPVMKSRSFITSGGLGAMGFGLGAAIGAKLAQPERAALLITGDGSFRMNSSELATAVSCGIPVIILVINNGALGMVRQWQRVLCEGRYSETTLPGLPDIPALAAAYGVAAFRARTPAELRGVLESALAEHEQGRSAVIEAFVEDAEMCFPDTGGR